MRKFIFFFYLIFYLLSCAPTIIEKRIIEYRTPNDSTFTAYLNTIYAIIKNTYLDSARIDSEQLVYGAAKGMVEALGDTYSALYTPQELILKRKEEKGTHTRYMVKDSIAMITIPAFVGNTTEEFFGIIGGLLSSGKINSLIVDVRDNPGGFIGNVQSLVGLWIPKDSVLCYVQERDTSDVYYPLSAPFGITVVGLSSVPLARYPTVVLVNKNSASAAEMFAAALKDYGKTIVIGERTFGKGRIQEQHNFADGSVLRIIHARFTSPNKHAIDRVGVIPDIIVAQDTTSGIDMQMAVAIAYLKNIRKR